MSSPIKAGDLVMIVRTCCERPIVEGVRLGLPWTVESVHIAMPPSRCPSCGASYTDCVFMKEVRPRWSGAPISWVKKLEPPTERESDVTRSEVTA